MKKLTKHTIFGLSLLLGIGLIMIGSRFLIWPEAGEAGFGLTFPEMGNYSFHYIKGIRDMFSGLVIALLTMSPYRKALGIVLLCGTIIPVIDYWVVSQQTEYLQSSLYSHAIAAIVCLLLGVAYLLPSQPGVGKQ